MKTKQKTGTTSLLFMTHQVSTSVHSQVIAWQSLCFRVLVRGVSHETDLAGVYFLRADLKLLILFHSTWDLNWLNFKDATSSSRNFEVTRRLNYSEHEPHLFGEKNDSNSRKDSEWDTTWICVFFCLMATREFTGILHMLLCFSIDTQFGPSCRTSSFLSGVDVHSHMHVHTKRQQISCQFY